MIEGETAAWLQKRPAEEDHLALMGPIIRAEVGDRVVVHLQNKLDFTVNFEPQGLLASKDVYKVVAEPNATAVYTFGAPEQVPFVCAAFFTYNYLYTACTFESQIKCNVLCR